MPGIGTVLTMSGDDNDQTQAITQRFREQQAGARQHRFGGRGLNLHQRCHHLIHMELPPARIGWSR